MHAVVRADSLERHDSAARSGQRAKANAGRLEPARSVLSRHRRIITEVQTVFQLLMDPLALTLRFVDRLNHQDVDGLVALMSNDHQFIDSGGEVHQGRARMREGWRAYFRMVPDYHIDVHESFVDGPVVVLLGTAGGTYCCEEQLHPEDTWSTPAAWRVLVEQRRIVEWRVYADNELLRTRRGADPERVQP